MWWTNNSSPCSLAMLSASLKSDVKRTKPLFLAQTELCTIEVSYWLETLSAWDADSQHRLLPCDLNAASDPAGVWEVEGISWKRLAEWKLWWWCFSSAAPSLSSLTPLAKCRLTQLAAGLGDANSWESRRCVHCELCPLSSHIITHHSNGERRSFCPSRPRDHHHHHHHHLACEPSSSRMTAPLCFCVRPSSLVPLPECLVTSRTSWCGVWTWGGLCGS